MMRWLNKLIALFRREKRYRYHIVDEVPNLLKLGVIYLEINEGFIWEAVLLCPCGCGNKLHLNLMKEYAPYWQFSSSGDFATLRPSVDRKVGCHSHFFITAGRLTWC